MGRISNKIKKRFPGKKFCRSENYLVIIDGKVCAVTINAEDIIKAFFSFAKSGRLQIKRVSGFIII